MLDPASPTQANALLSAHGIRPRKRWGQNFLCDRNVVARVVGAAALGPDDRTLEVGTGLGVLTRALAVSSAHVTTVEIDPLLAPIIEEQLAPYTNVTAVQGDFLRLDFAQLLDAAFGPEPGVLVANIPYGISSPLVERLCDHVGRLRRAVLLVQREFADRLAAPAGADERGSLSVLAQFHFGVHRAGSVPPQVFWPQPAVTSTIVMLAPHQTPPVAPLDKPTFFRVTRAAFEQRRKTLANALVGGGAVARERVGDVLAAAGVDPTRRGETLTLEEFGRVADAAFSAPGP